ncbi:serine/threonine-protein kinase [Nonomuraea jiangxiensis]|uniref:serine/threonine-protein kinase n=1 Tax=Nonomuraea jiangxiensis TaxID=633440 RepID=UPI0015A27FC6|nr:serine/threonine-protein kinase [Nonomuraea jiangxiensis]
MGDPVIIGRYLLLGRLGTGGMGVVYLAEHPQGGLVALKTPHAVHLNDATLRARFAEEVAFSRRLVPFCTAAVVEDGTDGDRPFLVTEYIPGPALSQVVAAGGPLPPDLAYGLALGVAAALVAVHEAGLVHRDLKPANVLLSPRGPRVIDFGIARDVDTSAAHTQAGQVMGSPGWVAPERLTGGPAMPTSDVFAWGCLVAFAASGHHPFGTGEPDVLTRRIVFEPPRVEGVPALLRPAVEAALAKVPADRPRAADLLRVLLAAGGVGDPWDLRQEVAGVMTAIWTAVPHPPRPGRGSLAMSPGDPEPEEAGYSGPGESWEPGAPDGRDLVTPWARAGSGPWETGGLDAGAGAAAGGGAAGGRRRGRAGAHLSHATFAALATVSIAAVTVIAASGGDRTNADGGSLIPGDPPITQSEVNAGATARRTATPVGGIPPTWALPTTAPPTGPLPTGALPTPATATTSPSPVVTPTVFVTRTRTGGPRALLTSPPERKRTFRPSNTGAPGDWPDADPGECANPARNRRGDAARPNCPSPSQSISTIPQEGPGETLDPTVSASPTLTPTVTQSP